MACPQARDSIGKEAECEEIVITIPPEVPCINVPSDLPPAEWPECCIYRVPKQLRKVNEEAYTPKLVSIGPFHHDREEFREMETHKLRYFQDFFQRKTVKKSQEDLLKIIKDNEEKIRHCYSEDPLKIIKDNEEKIKHCYSEDDWRLESNDFVQMILLDAIFIIELFLKTGEDGDDYILNKLWLKTGIRHDLILLENQLPFFVLEDLYTSSGLSHHQEGQQIKEHKGDQNTPFLKLSLSYFSDYDQQEESIISEEVKHFTDLLRYLFCPPNMELKSSEGGVPHSPKKKEEEESPGTRFCATKLDHSGLKFIVKKDRRLLDITLAAPGVLERFLHLRHSCLFACFPCLICFPCFMKYLFQLTLPRCFGRPMHILEIPQLVIGDYTEAIFRNLMALEQCHYPSIKSYICNYALLLDSLIDTEKDVDLLVHKKVIVNLLGSNTVVTDLINKLCEQIVETRSSYFDYIAQNLNKHYEFPLNHFLATLRREYFPNVFRGTATAVGLIVLGFTLWNFIRPFVV